MNIVMLLLSSTVHGQCQDASQILEYEVLQSHTRRAGRQPDVITL